MREINRPIRSLSNNRPFLQSIFGCPDSCWRSRRKLAQNASNTRFWIEHAKQAKFALFPGGTSHDRL